MQSMVQSFSASSLQLRMPSNAAAWLTAAKANPLEVKSAPCTSPGENEIVIKNGAVAISPFDWMIQHMGDALYPLPYPSILGFDVVGEVVEVGSSGSRFTLGDRVLGQAVALKNNKASEGAFQTYTVLLSHMVSPIPSNLSLKPLLFSP